MLAMITGDWYWILLALIVLFGGSQLPKLAKNTGEALREFRKAHADTGSAPTPQANAEGQPTSVPTNPAPASAAAAEPPAPAQLQAGPTEERVTLTRSELDALLADREAHAKQGAAKPEA